MSIGIKTNKPWQKHSGYTPHKTYGSYYDERLKKRRVKIIRIIYVIVFILLVQSIFQAPFLALSKIELLGNSFYQEDEVKQYVQDNLDSKKWLFFQNNNFFLFDASQLKNQLITQYNLNDARVSKIFPNKLKIEFSEKTSQFIWQKNGSYYLLDAHGQVNGQINAINEQYVVLEDSRSYQPQNNQNIFRQDEMELIQVILATWGEKLATTVKIRAINIGDDWATFDIRTNLPYVVKINPQDQPVEQMEKYHSILIAGNVVGTDINYIDLRFGEKVYYR